MNRSPCIWLNLQASLAISEGVYRRVMDPMLAIILAAGSLTSFCLGFSMSPAGAEQSSCLFVIQGVVSVIMIFIGTTEIPRDLTSKRALFFLSKPLGRGGYLVGKYFGILFLGLILLFSYIACMALGAILQGSLRLPDFAVLVLQISLQWATLCSLLLLLSVILPELAATIFGLVFYLVGYVVFIIPPVVNAFFPDILKPLLMAIYYPIPNWQHYIWNLEGTSTGSFLLALTLYALCHATLGLMISTLYFRRRDLN